MVHSLQSIWLQALGIKPRTLRPLARAKWDKKDVAQLLSRGEEGEEPDPAAETDRIKGLGFAACAPWCSCSGRGKAGAISGDSCQSAVVEAWVQPRATMASSVFQFTSGNGLPTTASCLPRSQRAWGWTGR